MSTSRRPSREDTGGTGIHYWTNDSTYLLYGVLYLQVEYNTYLPALSSILCRRIKFGLRLWKKESRQKLYINFDYRLIQQEKKLLNMIGWIKGSSSSSA